jgi:hypothetical protein
MFLYLDRRDGPWLRRLPHRWHAADAISVMKGSGILADWGKLVALFSGLVIAPAMAATKSLYQSVRSNGVQTMIIMMPENKVKGAAKRLRKILMERGLELKHVQCLDLSARLHGFEGWQHYVRRDISAPFSPFDHDLSEPEFVARDQFQMTVLESAGLGAIARELLDRVNPTGSWARATTSNVDDQTLHLSTR